MLSRVEEIIAAQLTHQPVERIDGGYRYRLEAGTTDLTFRRPVGEPGPFELCAIATVETRFFRGLPDFTGIGLARANRRSAFGSLQRSTQDGIRSKLTFSIYGREPAAEWVAELLLTAFGHQLAFGMAAGQSQISDELLRGNRANLEYPRVWAKPLEQEALNGCVAQLRNAGFVSNLGRDSVVVEVPLAGKGPSRMVDPMAETALIRVSTNVLHPLAGVGYLGTIALPLDLRHSSN